MERSLCVAEDSQREHGDQPVVRQVRFPAEQVGDHADLGRCAAHGTAQSVAVQLADGVDLKANAGTWDFHPAIHKGRDPIVGVAGQVQRCPSIRAER